LPCPYCTAHAQGFLRKINFENVKTKENLIHLFLTFHNNVNKRLKKKEYSIKECDEIYKKCSFLEVLNDYNTYNNSKKSNNKAMLNNFHMSRISNGFMQKLVKELYKFNNIN
jgi:hypothetical protein